MDAFDRSNLDTAMTNTLFRRMSLSKLGRGVAFVMASAGLSDDGTQTASAVLDSSYASRRSDRLIRRRFFAVTFAPIIPSYKFFGSVYIVSQTGPPYIAFGV